MCNFRQLTESRADAACAWKSLSLHPSVCTHTLAASTLAYLPLHSLTQVGQLGVHGRMRAVCLPLCARAKAGVHAGSGGSGTLKPPF